MNNVPTEARLVTTLQRIAKVNSILVIGVGGLAMIGWLFDIPLLKRVLIDPTAMKFNTAVCFILSGAGLLNMYSRRWLAQFTAIVVILIALVTLGQYAFGWELGIDQLLVRDLTTTLHPGRMSIITAVIFTLAGTGLLLLASTRLYGFTQGVTLVALLVAVLAILGYIYDVRSLYTISTSSSIPLHTAILFSVLCFGMLFAFPNRGLIQIISANSVGGYLVRSALPIVALTPLVIGWMERQGELLGLYSTGFGLAMFTLSNMVVLSAITMWIASKLHKADIERLRALEAQRQINDALEMEVRQRTQAEEAIRTLNAELEQRVHERTVHLTAIIKELDMFNYSVSHDLRSPLRAMDGYAQVLLEDQADKLDDTAKHYLTRIRSASQRMGNVIDDLLQLAQLSRVDIASSSVDLYRVARDVIAELKEMYPEHQVECVLETSVIVTGDARLLRVALHNLLSNAWKFTRKQSHPRIEMGTIEHEGKQAYFVRDNGVGFDMRFSNKLFRAFQRLHDPQEYEGTGIGLAIVARVIQRHGGKIWAESAVDRGTTFYFTL